MRFSAPSVGIAAWCVAASLAPVHAQTHVSSAEIKALQQRLIDGGCYRGAVDGQTSPALQAAIKACPSQEPVLLIETGMHTEPIKRIGVDRACRIAATASFDKTVRVWSLPDGRLLHTLRVAIGPGDSGKIYAAAASPDGRWVAAGGWDAQWDMSRQDYVYIFDASTGAMVTRAGPFESVINHLTFSPDGCWLAASSSKNVGLKVISVQGWRVAASDKSYADDSYGAAFGPDGRLYTVAYDGKVRRYGPDPLFRKQREINTHGSMQPYSIAIDPRGQLIAVGFSDSQTVDVYDAATLELRFAADTKDFKNGNLSKVAWSSDGEHLMVGGSYEDLFQGAWKTPLLTFDRQGKQAASPLPLSDDGILNLQPCGEATAVAAGDPAFGLVNGNGRIDLWRSPATPDLRDKIGEAFTIAPNARQIRFGLGNRATEPVVFDLGQATVTDAPDLLPGFSAPVTDGLPVSDWKNDYAPKFAGKPIALNRYETSPSLAIRPDRSGFVLGTEYWLRAFNEQGRQLWGHAGPAIAWGVNFSANGRTVVVAYGDGTIRWMRWSDGRELLALFINRKTRAWVVWTPSGYYAASPGGEDLIGWHINRGWNQAADFFPASKFRDKYARADIVERVLDTLDEDEAVRQANLAGLQKSAPAAIIETLPPVLSILSPTDDAQIDAANVTIHYLLRSPSGTPIDVVESLINGAPASNRDTNDDRDVKKCIVETHGLGRTMGALQGCRGSLTVALPPGTSEIGVLARASSKSSNVAQIRSLAPPANSGGTCAGHYGHIAFLYPRSRGQRRITAPQRAVPSSGLRPPTPPWRSRPAAPNRTCRRG